MTWNLLFPGQGAQFVGMGKKLFEQFSAAKETFLEAEDLLKKDIRRLLFEGTEADLSKTANSQLAIYITSVASFRVLKKERPDLVFSHAVGLSLGEYSALTAIDSLSFLDGLRLVEQRGQLMQQASEKTEGGMAAVLKVTQEQLKPFLSHTSLVIANLNCPGQLVISGLKEELEQIKDQLAEKNIRVILLNVAGAFHSPLMESAYQEFKELVDAVSFKNPDIPIVLNTTAKRTVDPKEIKNSLPHQLMNTVLFQKSIEEIGCDQHFIECSPGTILKGLTNRIGVKSVISLDAVENYEEIGLKK